MQGVFNPNIVIYHLPNSAKGLHFSAFHFLRKYDMVFCKIIVIAFFTFTFIRNNDDALYTIKKQSVV